MMAPTNDEKEELLLSCRYGDQEDVENFVKQHGAAALVDARDENGNTVLHMVSANGHLELLDYLLNLLPPSLIGAQNSSGSTALHWAAVNKQLATAQKLVQHPGGPGIDLIDVKNSIGRSPLGEAEIGEWDEGAKWFVEVMRLDEEDQDGDGDETLEAGEAGSDDIQVEIRDAEGQVAKMTISAGTKQPPTTEPAPSST